MNNNQYDPNAQYQQNGQYQQNFNQQPNNGGDFMSKVKKFLFDTPVEKEATNPQDIGANKTLSVLSYLGILCWIPYVAANNSKFARFHSNQGLVLFLAALALGVANTIVSFILAFIPILGAILSSIISIASSLAIIGMIVLGIYNCVKGRANELPLIGNIRILKTSPVNNGFNNVNNGYNPNNNVNNNYNANNYNAVNNNANVNPQNTNYNANAYNNAPQQNSFDANAYSSGTPQQNTDSSNNGNA